MGRFGRYWQSLSLRTLSIPHLQIVPSVPLSQPLQVCSWACCITLAIVQPSNLLSSFFPQPQTVPLICAHNPPISLSICAILLRFCSFLAASLHNYQGWQCFFASFAVRPLSAWQNQVVFQSLIKWSQLLCISPFLMTFCWAVRSQWLHFCWGGCCLTLCICWSPSEGCCSSPPVCIFVSSLQPSRSPRFHTMISSSW